MNFLRRFMYGRYGFDALSNFILMIAVVLYIVFAIFDMRLLEIIPALMLALVYFRCFSRNIRKRSGENAKFKAIFRPFTSFFSLRHKMWADRKTHKYYKCPECSQRMRVPKGAGKILVKCPKCKYEFIVKT